MLFALWTTVASASVSTIDDAQRTVTLTAPAKRIVSLAPHATELLFAAGAGDKLVGVGEYSDYPPAAKRIHSVGRTASLDLERIVTLKPDLVVFWGSGNSASQIAKLRGLGVPLFESEPRDFETIASSMERLAHLSGTDAVGQVAAATFRARLAKLEQAYRHRPTVSVFYQIWREPLLTLNDAHLVSSVIRLCGGENSFGKLPQLTPTISVEAILQADPEVIIASNSRKDDTSSGWRRFPMLTAVKRDNLFSVHVDWLTRSGPRILDGIEELCGHLEVARTRRK